MLMSLFGASLALILFNKFIIISNPLFNMGFFNFYASEVIYPLHFVPLILSLLICIQKKKAFKKYILILSFIVLSFYNIHFISAMIIMVAILQLEVAALEKVYKILNKAILLCTMVGLYQFMTFNSIGLQMFGETEIKYGIKGLSTIDFYGHKIIRAYGTMAHPNILAGYIAVLTSYKWLNLITFSVSGVIAQINFLKFKIKSLLPLIIVLIIKNPFYNSRSYVDRVEEVTKGSTEIVHNVYLTLFSANILFLISYVFILNYIYRQDKKTAMTVFILGMFDHYFITHPQGVILLALSVLIALIRKQKMSDDRLKNF